MAKKNRVDIDWRREAQRESARVLLAETERNALRANIAVAVQQIREWMESDVSPFDARTGLRLPEMAHGDTRRDVQELASEVDALMRRAIGERTIAALITPASAPESPATAPTPPHPTHGPHHTHGDPQQTGGDA